MQEQSLKYTQNKVSNNHTEHTAGLPWFSAEKLHCGLKLLLKQT